MSVTVVDLGPSQVGRTVEVQAPAPELFAIVADPTRHHELDGSGTVRGQYSYSREIRCWCAIFDSNEDVRTALLHYQHCHRTSA